MKKLLTVILSAAFVIGLLAAPIKSKAATASSTAGTVTVSYGKLNVRSSGSTSSSILATLSKGSYITLISKSGSWWYVEYGDGKFGYCHSDYITTVSSSTATVSISSGYLNIRSGPGSTYSKIGTLQKGETVIILSSSGVWRRILFDGTETGYVSSVYLSSSAASTSYSAVSLNVPSYKQTDSRWANTLIGSSGKTIAQIGCATTAISMIESYRSGTAIYPNAMSKKLKYTSSGSVYWPSDYTAYYSSNGYLSNIYNQLKLGKPVLIGLKNKYGSQHWVVITGFTGGNSLTASRFTINDPGSKTRTNLQQLLNSYPTLYKYFFYN